MKGLPSPSQLLGADALGRQYRTGLKGDWSDDKLADRIRLLREGQAMPLSIKIGKAQALIMQVVAEQGEDKVYLAFSGGEDSAVLGHLVECMDLGIEFVFNDTGLEFPETYEYVRWWEKEFGREITRNRPLMKLPDILERYGYPLYSKRIAQILSTERRKENLRNESTRPAGSWRLLEKAGLTHLLDVDIKISDECCKFLKHGPAEAYAKQKGFTAAILGMRADDSRDRRRNWLDRGCYYPVQRGTDRVWPLAFWTANDVVEYHHLTGLPRAGLYDKGFTRNGCRLCGFGCHLSSPNKFELFAMWYPKFWKNAMTNLGYFDVCSRLGIPDGRNIRSLEGI